MMRDQSVKALEKCIDGDFGKLEEELKENIKNGKETD